MFIYALLDDGQPRYVGWSHDVPARLDQHWRKRHSKSRERENPALCEWLSGLLFPPAYKILDRVPWHCRYEMERNWTVRLSARYRLVNISFGAAPLHRGPLTAEHRAKISLAKRRGVAESPVVAA